VYEDLLHGFLVNGDDIGIGKDYDSRAMRKVPEGSDIAVVIETSAVSLGAVVQTAGRVLVKLH